MSQKQPEDDLAGHSVSPGSWPNGTAGQPYPTADLDADLKHVLRILDPGKEGKSHSPAPRGYMVPLDPYLAKVIS